MSFYQSLFCLFFSPFLFLFVAFVERDGVGAIHRCIGDLMGVTGTRLVECELLANVRVVPHLLN